MLRLLGNLIWILFGGLVMGLAWWFTAVVCAITIVGIPWAIAAWRIGSFSFWPFGRVVVDKPGGALASGIGAIGNIVWALLFGWWLALGHLMSALLCAITIIGIPFAVQHVKLAGLAFLPYGRQIVTLPD